MFSSLSHADAFRLDFEDTYDGLGDQLDETDDVYNDDTFGADAGPVAKKPVGKDFDFFGQTAQVSDAFNEEQMRFSRQAPLSRVTPTTSTFSQPLPKPARTGYERYKEPDYIPDMQVDANLWGVAPKRPVQAPPVEAPITPGLPSGKKTWESFVPILTSFWKFRASRISHSSWIIVIHILKQPCNPEEVKLTPRSS
jgi:DNA topoisomerase 2-associated protein PAT1